MRIGDIQPMPYSPQTPPRTAKTSGQGGADIGKQLQDAINTVNEQQNNADSMMEKVATGDIEDTHKAMISMEHALMTLDFSLQVRNKVLEAYQEIMRTQM